MCNIVVSIVFKSFYILCYSTKDCTIMQTSLHHIILITIFFNRRGNGNIRKWQIKNKNSQTLLVTLLKFDESKTIKKNIQRD